MDLGRIALEGQARLRAVKCLNLRFFTATQHQRVHGRIEVQADDVLKLLNEMCIVGKFERLDPMRLESMGEPDAGNGRSAGAQLSSQGARAPVRRASVGIFFKRDPHHLFHVDRIARCTRTTRARRVLKQSIDASSEKARLPARYNPATIVKLLRDVLVRHPGRSQQHDAIANLNARFNTFALGKTSQAAIIVGTQLDWLGNMHGTVLLSDKLEAKASHKFHSLCRTTPSTGSVFLLEPLVSKDRPFVPFQ